MPASAITKTISHDATTDQVVTDDVNIGDQDVIGTGGATFIFTEGAAPWTLHSFPTRRSSDLPSGLAEDASDYSATINWGDGTIEAGTIVNNLDGTFSVVGKNGRAHV